MKKKICIFCSLSSFNTGMPISTYKLAAGLVREGRFDVCAVLPEEGDLGSRLRGAGAGVTVIPFNRVRAKPALLLLFVLTYFTAGFRFYRFIKKRGIDIVHFSDIIDAPFYPWAKLAGARVVGHVRVCTGGAIIRRIFRCWAQFFCSRIITVSKFTKCYYGFGKRAAVIYNPGPDRENFNFNATAPIPPNILTVASFRYEKGHHNFLKIASSIIKKYPSKQPRFTIIGGKVPGHEKYYNEIMGDIKRMGLDGCLTVTDNIPHEQVAAIMFDAAILLHVPDWEEALGGVVLEAMASGAAVVAYDCGGVGECFTNGVSGFLVKRGKIDEVADRAVSLLSDFELREKIVTEARKELDAKFSMALYIGGVEKIYDSICR
ncbi:MAG: glycosyltransferase family 4 protein [Chitinispirillales bacterium]|jgi:glycosyltransferase involved in cell wall biosynthesis|nr:glycosyltransferase family 4 protein [Chitinispirillales bacterium]